MDDYGQEQVIEEKESTPALVINIHSWATPIIGVLMLLVGALLGYVGRPYLSARIGGAAAQSLAPTVAVAGESSANSEAGAPASTPTLMEFLIGQTRHFKGDPNAPVTMIEFSDYQ